MVEYKVIAVKSSKKTKVQRNAIIFIYFLATPGQLWVIIEGTVSLNYC